MISRNVRRNSLFNAFVEGWNPRLLFSVISSFSCLAGLFLSFFVGYSNFNFEKILKYHCCSWCFLVLILLVDQKSDFFFRVFLLPTREKDEKSYRVKVRWTLKAQLPFFDHHQVVTPRASLRFERQTQHTQNITRGCCLLLFIPFSVASSSQ